MMLLSVLGSILGGEDDSVTLMSPGPLAVIGVMSGVGLTAEIAVISGTLCMTGASCVGVGERDRSLGIMFAICVNGVVARVFNTALSISGPCVSSLGEGRGVEWVVPLPDATGSVFCWTWTPPLGTRLVSSGVCVAEKIKYNTLTLIQSVEVLQLRTYRDSPFPVSPSSSSVEPVDGGTSRVQTPSPYLYAASRVGVLLRLLICV